jgi:TrmH family RNA methyltransferase
MISRNQVKYLNSLKLGKFRDLNRQFIAEGVKLVDEMLASHFPVHSIYALPSWISSHTKLQWQPAVEVFEVTEPELKKISNLATPNEVLAVVGYHKAGMPEPKDLGDMALILDRIQDPGNLGTMIRTADWFGIGHIICSPGTADVYNPKVVQATMGSICRVSVHYQELKDFLVSAKNDREIYGTLPDGANIYDAELLYPSVIIIGNESKGISADLMPLISRKIGIPSLSKGAESLNAAVAAGIICSEFRRKYKEF